MYKRNCFIFTIFILSFFAYMAFSQEGISNYGDQGLFHLYSSTTLLKGKFLFGIIAENIDRDPLDIDTQSDSISFGYGITDKFQIGGVITPYTGHDIDLKTGNIGFYNTKFVSNNAYFDGFGDIIISAKYNFIDKYEKEFGTSLRGFVKLPTADEKEGVGTGKADLGLDLILDKIFNNRFGLGVNLGVGYYGNPDNSKLGTRFNYGIGCYFPHNKSVQALAEIVGGILNNDAQIENYADVSLGVRFSLDNGFNFTAGVRRNILGESSKDENPNAIIATLGYVPKRYIPPAAAPAVPPPPPVPPPAPPAPKAPAVVEVAPPYAEIYFDFDKYNLREEEIPKLDAIAQYLIEHPDIDITIEGHTCYIGTEEYNMALGTHRAEAVKNYLISKGVQQERIKTISYGETMPKYDNSKEETRRFNRRAWFIEIKEK